jgi:putative spermidine/putrescine transport system substrate-binding protein
MTDASRRETIELVESYMTGQMSRRVFIQRLLALGLSASAAGAILAACNAAVSSPSPQPSSAPASAPPASAAPVSAAPSSEALPNLAGQSIVFVSWGGSYQEAEDNAWLKPFAAATSAKILQDSPPDYSKIKAMVEAGQVTWDVIDVEGEFGLDRDGPILEPIDYTVVSKKGVETGATTYRVAFMTYSSVLGYNSSSTKGKVPSGWTDFFDLTAFPGKRGVPTDAHDGLFEACLLADGVAQDQIYPIDADRALAKLTTIKDQLVFTTSSAQKQDLLSTGETAMGFIGNGRAYAAKKEGHPVDVAWSGHVDFADFLVVPKGSPNRAAAMNLIAYIVAPENNAELSKYISYSPANSSAKIPEGVAADELTSSHLDVPYVIFSDEWWSANYDAVNAKYQAWKQA